MLCYTELDFFFKIIAGEDGAVPKMAFHLVLLLHISSWYATITRREEKMSFKLTVENFGKLTEAEIRIGQFTVFAGPNNTGKSFVSKLLYSLFDVMNAEHASMYFNMLSRPLYRGLFELTWGSFSKEEENDMLLEQLDSILSQLEKSFELERSRRLEENWDSVVNYGDELRAGHTQLERNLDKWEQEEGAFESSKSYRRTLARMKEDIDRLRGALNTNAREFIMDGIKERVSQNLVQNFQTASLSNLRKDQTRPARIILDNVVEFTIENTRSVNFKIKDEAGFHGLQEYSRVIYLESPLYWKLKSALEGIKMAPRFRSLRGRDALSGVPGYFYDLARALREEYPENDQEDLMNLCERLFSKDVMDGRLTVSESGELRFEDNKHDTSFPLQLAAMGVANLGILALLIERRIIDKGSFLFVDEPGAHLHPSWQIKIAKTLFELSRLGVNVVIATHSVDMLKFLEVEAKKNPESKKLIALNRFSSEGVEGYEEDFESKLNTMQQDLTDPFATLFLEGL